MQNRGSSLAKRAMYHQELGILEISLMKMCQYLIIISDLVLHTVNMRLFRVRFLNDLTWTGSIKYTYLLT